jgi:hypothetical protein
MRQQKASRTVLLGTLFLLLPGLPAILAAEAPAAPSGTCKTNGQCGKDEFCAKFFGSCEDSGKCEAKPQDCTERGKLLVKPVCGCDGKSYDNFCLAAAAGVNVKLEGKCAP